jgi:uncharacterized protein (DUF849 family)
VDKLDVNWAVCSFGIRELECLSRAVELGGDARIGFENNLLCANGEQALNNAAQVEALRQNILAQGRTPATAAEVRNLMFNPLNQFKQQQALLN